MIENRFIISASKQKVAIDFLFKKNLSFLNVYQFEFENLIQNTKQIFNLVTQKNSPTHLYTNVKRKL